MGAVTYSTDEVAGILNQEVIPVQLPYDAKPQSRDYNVKWTPATRSSMRRASSSST